MFIKPDYESGFGDDGEFNMKYFGITSIDVEVNEPQVNIFLNHTYISEVQNLLISTSFIIY